MEGWRLFLFVVGVFSWMVLSVLCGLLVLVSPARIRTLLEERNASLGLLDSLSGTVILVLMLLQSSVIGVVTVTWWEYAATASTAGVTLFLVVGGGVLMLAGAAMAAKDVWPLPFFLKAASFLALPAGVLEGVLGKVGEEDVDQGDSAAADIKYVVEEGEKEGAIEEDEKEMIENVLSIADTDVSQIMTPRMDVVFVDAGMTLEEASQVAARSGFSRFPVYAGGPDDVVGVLYVKDMIKYGQGSGKRVKEVMREPFLVPETKSIKSLLREMRTRKVHIAVVIDEYGGMAGLVTIEDILEEIVGEIEDEHDASKKDITLVEDNCYEVDGRMPIKDFNEELDLDLPTGEGYDTVAGFVVSRFGRIPGRGEYFRCDGVTFTVIDADERRVKKVKVVVDESPDDNRKDNSGSCRER